MCAHASSAGPLVPMAGWHRPRYTRAMTRRRLTLAIVAAVLIGTAWWQSLHSLSAEERLLVGMWTFDG